MPRTGSSGRKMKRLFIRCADDSRNYVFGQHMQDDITKNKAMRVLA
jgi:hypothetical protein